MSLLTNLVTQIAQNAIQSKMGGHMPQSQGGMGGLDSVLGGMLGGNSMGNSGINMSNGFGMDDIIGMAMNQNRGMSQGGMLGQVLGSVLGGGMGGMGNNMGMNRMPQSQGGFGGKGMLMAALLPLALMFIQRNGGLSGALSKIQNMGFGGQANSWVSAGQANEQIDANVVSQLFDPSDLQQVAAQTGYDTNEVSQGMAELLPQVFDNLTPNGNIETEHEANNEISDLLNQLSATR